MKSSTQTAVVITVDEDNDHALIEFTDARLQLVPAPRTVKVGTTVTVTDTGDGDAVYDWDA